MLQPEMQATQSPKQLFMKTTVWGGLAAAVVLCFTPRVCGQPVPPVPIVPGGPPYAPGEVLVQFRTDATDSRVQTAFQHAGLGLIKHFPTPAMHDQGRAGLTRASTAMPVPVAVGLLNSLPGVEFAEPNWEVTADETSNEPYYADPSILGPLWGMYDDDTPALIGPVGTYNPYASQTETAWAAGFVGSSDICVGIIDTGLQPDHEDLASNVWTNPGEIPGNGIHEDGNGYVDDVNGWNAIANNGVIYDPGYDVHGTYVAGTIGAVGGNGIGVAGVNWRVTMISGKFLGRNGSGWTSDAVEAVDYMTALKSRKGLNIVALDNSWGGSGFSQAILDAITRAANLGIVFVPAAGNAATDTDATPFYPACYDTSASAGFDAVIAVGAINRDGNKSSFWNYGLTRVDLGAPGGERANLKDSSVRDPNVEIVSTVPTNAYGHLRGTSMATPHVTGAVALYASVSPGASAPQTREGLLTAGVWPLEALQGLTVAGGILDVGKLMEVEPIELPAPDAPVNVLPKPVAAGEVNDTWIDQSANELGFAVERSTDGLNFTLADTVGANAAGYADCTVLANTTYLCQVRAFNAAGASGYAEAAAFVKTPTMNPPTAPSNLRASAQPPAKGGGAAMSWSDRSKNESAFQIERRVGNNGLWLWLTNVPANTTKYIDLTTASGNTYSYRLRAFNAGGASGYSSTVTAKAR